MSTSTMIIFLCTSCLIVSSASEDIKITPIKTSSGLYYEKIGDVLLTNSKWEFVTSVDYRGYLLFYEYLFNQAKKIEEICQNVRLTECNSRSQSIRGTTKRIANTNQVMANFLGIENGKRRVKRFWQTLALAALPYLAKPLGEGLANKIFGNTDQVQLEKFYQQVEALQVSQQELDYKVDEQATIFKIDSERKNYQIQWLGRMQNEIKNKIKILEATFILDGEAKAKEIDNLKTMLTETQTKIKMQQDIQNNTITEIETIKNKLNNVNDDINFIYKTTNDTNNTNIQLNKAELNIKLNSLSINLMFLLTEFETKQRELLSVITKANRGELDPYIITPLNLIQMLQQVKSMLPEGTKFPLNANLEYAQNIYKIIKTTVYLYKNKILFMLSIPLVNLKTFDLHKMTSLPTLVSGNKFAFILPKNPYLLVDKTDREYMMLSFENFQLSCKEISNSTHLCEQIQQTAMAAISRSECEINIFLEAKNIPNSCNKRVISLEKTMFLQLQEPSSWIYAVPDDENLIFTCPNGRHTIMVRGTGILRTGGCSVRTPDLNLLTIAKFSTPAVSSYSPDVNLRDFINIESVGDLESKTLQTKQIISPLEYNELREMSWSFKDIPESNKTGVYVWTIIGAVVILATVLLISYLFYKRINFL